MNQSSKALAEIDQACLQLGQAAQTLQDAAHGTTTGINCACSEGHCCAYHAGLINTLDGARRRAGEAASLLRADLKDPTREH